MSEDAAPRRASKGLANKLAKLTAIILAVVALLDAANSLATRTQSLTCKFGVKLPWCSIPSPDSKAPDFSVDAVQVCKTNLDNAREKKRLSPMVDASAVHSFEATISVCVEAKWSIDQSKLKEAGVASAGNDFQTAYDLYDEAFGMNQP
jgi:hypothetical protein